MNNPGFHDSWMNPDNARDFHNFHDPVRGGPVGDENSGYDWLYAEGYMTPNYQLLDDIRETWLANAQRAAPYVPAFLPEQKEPTPQEQEADRIAKAWQAHERSAYVGRIVTYIEAKIIEPPEAINAEEASLWFLRHYKGIRGRNGIQFWSEAPHRGPELPQALSEWSASMPDFTERMIQLQQAQERLQNLGAFGAQIIANPWQSYLENLDTFHDWLSDVAANTSRRIPDVPAESLSRDSAALAYHGQVDEELGFRPSVTLEEYLETRIAQDGPWGLTLVQTSTQGTPFRKFDDVPNWMLNKGDGLTIKGLNLGAMGVFEKISTELQTNHRPAFPMDAIRTVASRSTASIKHQPQEIGHVRWSIHA